MGLRGHEFTREFKLQSFELSLIHLVSNRPLRSQSLHLFFHFGLSAISFGFIISRISSLFPNNPSLGFNFADYTLVQN